MKPVYLAAILFFMLPLIGGAQNSLKEIQDQEKLISERSRFVAGIYPVGLFSSSEKRDVGGVLGVIVGSSMTLVSYTTIGQNKYQMFDLFMKDIDAQGFSPKWDGYRVEFFFRNGDGVFRKNKLNFFHGLNLAYEHQQLVPFTSEVTKVETEQTTSEIFEPLDRSFRVHFNPGFTYYRGFWGFDLNLSVGVFLNSFQLKNDEFKLSPEYKFGNPLLENRDEGSLHYGPSVRLNFATFLFF